MIYTVTFNPAIDCAMSAESVTVGRVNRVSSQTLRFGGKGINVSYVLKEFGGGSVLTGFTAGFTGDALSNGLLHEGFICDFVKLGTGNTRINVKLKSQSTDGDPDTELNASGPVPSADELTALTDKLSRLTAEDTVVIAGSLPTGVSPDYINTVADALPGGVSLICDLSGDALRSALKSSPDLVKPNIHELYGLLGIPATAENIFDRDLIQISAAKLISMGARNVLISMGENGAYYADSNGNAGFVPSPSAPNNTSTACSAVGCGDSAVAGWLIGMGYAGEDVRRCALSYAGIDDGISRADTAARLAVMIGSASYYYGFPASPKSVHLMKQA